MSFYKKLSFQVIILVFFTLANLYGQEQDSVKNYWISPVEVNAKKLNLGESSNQISKDNLSNILDNHGFHLIKKGVYFAQDIYADGFKKGDINVVVDGERYHSACPNRMDSPLVRVNPLELQSVELIKSSSNLQSGLGGVVYFTRSLPKENFNLKADITTTVGALTSTDIALSGDFKNHRLSFRYAEGTPFEDAENNTFVDSYGYKDNYKYKLAEVLFRGNISDWNYGMSFTYTDNISFPYLKMDERLNWVYSGFARYKSHKLYFNYTHHIMDNGLRVSPMRMETNAKNLTIGAIGNFYEAVFRSWKADNYFKSPMFYFTNDLMPNVNMYMVNLFKTYDFSGFTLHGKAGFNYQNINEEERKEFYQQIYDDVKTSRFFPTFSIGLSHMTAINNNLGAGFLIEANSEAPETETMFIAVKKPGTKPAWVGNPELSQPVKASIRASLHYNSFTLEAYGTRVWNYVNLTRTQVVGNNFLTYNNIDAMIYGLNLNGKYEFIELDASYTWAKNITSASPLSEITPLTVHTTLVSPKYYGVRFLLKHIYNDAQLRVDESLNEVTTPAWNKLNIGFDFNYLSYTISVMVENITNQQYYQHLSFLRDPFASGFRVYEPGRTFRITLKTNQLF